MNTFGRDFAKVGLIYRKDVSVKDHPIDLRFIENASLDVLGRNRHKFPSARFIFQDKLMVQMALKLCAAGLSSLGSSSDRAVCKQGMEFWMRYLNLGELDPLLEECENFGFLDKEQ